ncbi:hypothetical protein [Nonomuraea sp. NPDC049480]|uniref:hypothetical protein n=1 Tax=Nonomuraea sp. NPDC049480 TaxID=3364353 RepID=UPI0037B4AD3E
MGGLLDDLSQAAELDFNPVIVTPDGATTVDARIRITSVSRHPRRCCAACADQRLRRLGLPALILVSFARCDESNRTDVFLLEPEKS